MEAASVSIRSLPPPAASRPPDRRLPATSSADAPLAPPVLGPRTRRPLVIVLPLVLLGLLVAPASAQMLRHGGEHGGEAAPAPLGGGTAVGRWSFATDRLGRGRAN